MSRTEFNTCEKCGIGKMKPTGRSALSNDPDTNRLTGDYREYKCDNCGHPQGGYAKVIQVNEQIGVGEPTNTSSSNNNNSCSSNKNNRRTVTRELISQCRTKTVI